MMINKTIFFLGVTVLGSTVLNLSIFLINSMLSGRLLSWLGGVLKKDLKKVEILSPVLESGEFQKGKRVKVEDDERETFCKNLHVENPVVLLVFANSFGEFRPGNTNSYGELDLLITLDDIPKAGDSCVFSRDFTKRCPAYLKASAAYATTIDKGNHLIQVEASYIGCIDNPTTSMHYMLLRDKSVSLGDVCTGL